MNIAIPSPEDDNNKRSNVTSCYTYGNTPLFFSTVNEETHREFIPIVVKQTVEYWQEPPLAATCYQYPLKHFTTTYNSYYFNTNK